MFRPAARLAAGTLALALPLAAAAGCGVEKKMSIKAEFAAAQAYLDKSKAVSVTLHLADADGNLAKEMRKTHAPDAVVQAVLHGSVTITVGTAGAGTLGTLSKSFSPAQFASSLKKIDYDVAIRDDKDVLGEVRLVGGDLYARVNLAEVNRLVKASGGPDVNAKIDAALGSLPPQLAQLGQAVKDVRAGKWLKLPLSKYLDQLQKAVQSAAPQLGTATKSQLDGMRGKLLDALRPYVKVTDANDSSSDRVLDVRVRVKPAVTALLGVLQGDKALPFGGMFGRFAPTAIADNLSDGTADGTITLRSSHLTQVAVDIESLRLLSKDPGKDSAAGVRLVADIDDSAGQVGVPGNVSTVDLGTLFQEFFGAMMQRAAGSAQLQSYPLTAG